MKIFSQLSKVRDEERGVALLIAMILSAIILSIALSLSVVALRENATSGLAEHSMRALYASETAHECAHYWIVNDSNAFLNGGTIYCNDIAKNPTSTKTTINIQYPDAFAKAIVSASSTSKRQTFLVSARGYGSASTTNPFVVERARKDMLIKNFSDSLGDIMVAYDTSGSVGSNYGKLTSAVKGFLGNMLSTPPDTDGNMIGALRFSEDVELKTEGSTPLSFNKDDFSTIGSGRAKGNTDMGEALHRAWWHLVEDGRTDNVKFPDYIVLITDGEPNFKYTGTDMTDFATRDKWKLDTNCTKGNENTYQDTVCMQDTIKIAKAIRESGTTIFTVFVGTPYPGYDNHPQNCPTLGSTAQIKKHAQDLLRDCVATHKSNHAFVADKFSDLDNILGQVLSEVQVELLELK